MQPGAYQETWDGNTDAGIAAGAGTYTLKVLYNNVQDTWEGVIGNTSASFTGPNIYDNISEMQGMAFNGSGSTYTAYTANAYPEGGAGSDTFTNLTGPQSPTSMVNPTDDANLTLSAVATDGARVYYMNIGGSDTHKFIFAINTSNDSMYNFSSGTAYKDSKNITYYTLGLSTTATPTGMDVEKTGGILAVSNGSNNSIALFNKVSGASLGTLTDATHLTNPGGLAFAPVVNSKQCFMGYFRHKGAAICQQWHGCVS